MHQGIVRLIPQKCSTCGQYPVRPITRRSETVTESIIEAIWSCPRCGSKFASGILQRIAKEVPGVKEDAQK